jgi:Domain of unknown function (DUF4133)
MARVYPVFRGVDNELEFRGLRGKYFYYAVAGAIGSIFLTLMLYILGVNVLLAMLLMVMVGGGALYYNVSSGLDLNRFDKHAGLVFIKMIRHQPCQCMHQRINR